MGRRRGHGEGSIHLREDGRWCASVDLGWINGKRRRKYVYGKTRKEVADKLKVIHRDLGAGLDITTDRQTVKVFLERWLSEVVSQRNKVRTYEGYERIVELYLNPAIGHIPIGKLTPQHVQRLVNDLAGKGLAPNTVRNARAVLRRALNQALKWGLVSRNVATLVDTPRIEQQEMSPLNEKQARALLRALKGDRLEALYVLTLSLGLRRGEVLGLRWADLDFDAGTIRVVQTVQRTRTKGLIIVPPKTKSSIRRLSIPPFAVKKLRTHRERQNGVDNPHGLIFVSTVGTPLEPDNVTHHFKTILKKAKLPDTIRLHDLRHSCATFLLAQGVAPRVVMEYLGHDQISTTMNIYAHVMPENLKEAAARMGELLEDGEDQQEEEDAKERLEEDEAE